MKKGEIYMIISPNNKRYIGQTIFTCEKRWKRHIISANNNSNCILHKAIRKYGANNFIVKPIFICNLNELNYYEVKFIRKYNTFSPNGYNMTTGGQLNQFTDDVRKRISESLKGNKNYFYGKHWSNEQKLKLLNTLNLLNRTSINKNLPMYLHYYKRFNTCKKGNSIKEGYVVQNHPILKSKTFCSMKLSMEQKLELAKNYLTNL